MLISTHLCTRIYASIALHLGLSPVFLSCGASESVLCTSQRCHGKRDRERGGTYHLILHCCRPRFPPIFLLTTPQKISLSISFPCSTVISDTICVSSSSSSLVHAPAQHGVSRLVRKERQTKSTHPRGALLCLGDDFGICPCSPRPSDARHR